MDNDVVVSVNKIVNPDNDETIKKDNAEADAAEAESNVSQTSLLDTENN